MPGFPHIYIKNDNEERQDMRDHIRLSLETHLFFARIMKEHAFFLEAGFVCADTAWIGRADWFRKQFEELLSDVVRMSGGRVSREVLQSGELVTQFTIPSERRTGELSGVLFDTALTAREKELRAGCPDEEDRELAERVDELNGRAIRLLDGLIAFKENILEEVGNGRIFTFNYRLLIEHILRETKLYRATVEALMRNGEISVQDLRRTEDFWNQIMMEHALFIRGLLDPSEDALIRTANRFAAEYKELLEQARRQDRRAMGMREESLAETLRLRQFKAAGTEGILKLEISSIILPLLADHVLREANHYIRLLES